MKPSKIQTLKEFVEWLKEEQKVGMRQMCKVYSLVKNSDDDINHWHDRLVDGKVFFYELDNLTMSAEEIANEGVLDYKFDYDGTLNIEVTYGHK